MLARCTKEMFRGEKLKEDSLKLLANGPSQQVGQESEAVYEACLNRCLRIIVGDAEFASKIGVQLIPEWANSSDEALSILLLENCWGQEADIYFHKKMSADDFTRKNEELANNDQPLLFAGERARLCRWSSGVQSSNGNGHVQGWTNEGLQRFNALQKRVADWRATDQGKAFYQRILNKHREQAGGKNKRKRSSVQKEWVKVHTDWSDDEECECEGTAV